MGFKWMLALFLACAQRFLAGDGAAVQAPRHRQHHGAGLSMRHGPLAASFRHVSEAFGARKRASEPVFICFQDHQERAELFLADFMQTLRDEQPLLTARRLNASS